MANSLKLEILLAAVDQATAPLKRVTQSSQQASTALKDLYAKQREVQRIQGDISSYQKSISALNENRASLEKVTTALDDNRAALSAARSEQKSAERDVRNANQQYQRLSNKVIKSSEANQELSRQLDQARISLERTQSASSKAANKADQLAKSVKKASDEQRHLRASTERISGNILIYAERLKKAGVDTQQLSTTSATLKTREDALTESITRQKLQLEALKATQDKVTAARNKYQASLSTRNNLAVTGIGSELGAERIHTFLTPAIQASEKFQNQEYRISTLGQGQAQTQAAVNYAKNHQAYGVSQTDVLEQIRDGMTTFGSEAKAQELEPILARMKFANDALYGEEQGEDRSRLFMDMMKAVELRGGVNNPAEFARQANMIQQVINASGGRVNADEWLQVIKTGSVAVRGLDDAAFYYKLEPMIQEMGGQRVGTSLMSLYQNLYQGRIQKGAARDLEKWGLIGDKSKVSFDKVGQQAFVGPGALLDGDLFKRDMFAWIDKVFIPQLKKHGITTKSQIMDAVGAVIPNRTASGIVSSYIMQQQANERRARLNARADGIDNMYDKARHTTQSVEVNLAARRADLYKTMGDTILPAYTRALEVATNAVVKLNHFMQENPRLTKAMLIALSGLGVILGICGAITLAMAAMWGPLALVRLGFQTLGIRMGVAAASGGIVTRIIAKMGRVLNVVRLLFEIAAPVIAGVATLIGRTLVAAIMSAGRALLMLSAAAPIITAIGLIIAGLAYAGYEIYKHWDTVSRFFIRSWGEIKTATGEAADYIKQKWAGMIDIAHGIWDGIRSAFHKGIRGIATLLVNWSPVGLIYKGFALLMQYLGVHVPSSLSGAGMTMMHALGDGIVKGFKYVKDKVQAAWNWIRGYIPGMGNSGNVSIQSTHTTEAVKQSKDATQQVPSTPLILKKAALTSAMASAMTGTALATPVTASVQPHNHINVNVPRVVQTQHNINIDTPRMVMPHAMRSDNAPAATHHIRVETPPIVQQRERIRFDNARPVASRTSIKQPDDNRQYHFTIHAAPGMDPQAVASAVRAELDRRENQQKARQRSSLTDRH